MPKIYIDCTMTYNSDLHTGIQRVVRQVIKQSLSNDTYSSNIQPVIFTSHGFIPVNDLLPHAHEINPVIETTKNKEKKTLFSFRRFLKKLVSTQIARWLKSVIANTPWLYRFLYALYVNMMGELARPPINTDQTKRFQPQEGDTLLLLDASWHLPLRHHLESLREKNIFVAAVIYDLIPISHPQFCSKAHTENFKEFIEMIAFNADMLIGISKSVQKDIADYTSLHFPDAARNLRFDYFYLGADFVQNNNPKEGVRDSIKTFFYEDEPVYLMVSTIEPRKNHAYLLDAFELLWNQGEKVRLCFIGREGWKIESLMKRINTHPEKSRRFDVWHDATDAELAYAYAHSKALVFPSMIEGFGLPIIEALEHSLPVFASDIPIHREIGGENIAYFDLNNPATLADAIRVDKAILPPKGYRWINWKESAQMLLHKLPQMKEPHE